MTASPKSSRTAGFTTLMKCSAVYFAIVFGAGFALGPIRILVLAPKIGERTAELLEMPVMLAVSAATAHWVLRRFPVPARTGLRLALGFLALLFMLLAEFALVVRLRNITIEQYFATRDPISGAAYYLSLLLFALFPSLLDRRRTDS